MEARLKPQCSMAQGQSSPLTHVLGKNKLRTREATGTNSHLPSRGKILGSKHRGSLPLTGGSTQGGEHCSFYLASRNCCMCGYSLPNTTSAQGTMLLPPQPMAWDLRLLLTCLLLIQSPTLKYLLHTDDSLGPRLPPLRRQCLSAQVQCLRSIPMYKCLTKVPHPLT